MSSHASVTFPAPAPSICATCHSLWHHSHNPQLQPYAGSFAQSQRASATVLTTSPQTRQGLWSQLLKLHWLQKGLQHFMKSQHLDTTCPQLCPQQTAKSLISPRALSGEIHQAAHHALPCPPHDTQPLHTRSMRGAFCFRRRRLCLLIRREALLCSVELLNLEAKARVSSSAARVVALSATEPQKWHRE